MTEEKDFIPCLTCVKSFSNVAALRQHQKDVYHFKTILKEPPKLKALTLYLNAFYEQKAIVLRDDRKKSRVIVKREINKIREELQKEDEFNGFKIEPAGSTATQTKVHLPDEYDFNIVIEPDDIHVRDSTHASPRLNFDLRGTEKNNCHLREKWEFQNAGKKGKKIPESYATARYKDRWRDNEEEWVYQGFIVPRKIQEFLYEIMDDAFRNQENISLSCAPHGPALTFRIHPPPIYKLQTLKENVIHEISVDMAIAIKVDKDEIPITKYGWPRARTEQCLLPEVIERIKDQNVYLVAKSNLFWYISFCNAAKVLLRSIDSTDTCRRKVHKILKADFLTWHSQRSYPGISTYIFKNHLFWFNERVSQNREQYWNNSNLGKCYVDLLKDLVTRLKERRLPNYFNESENILQCKDEEVLDRLAHRIERRIHELDCIKLC